MSELALTRPRAEKSLLQVEKRLLKELEVVYNNFMQEYRDLGHMSVVKDHRCGKYYLPHHEVLREAGSTTPLRVVCVYCITLPLKLAENRH